MCLLTDYDRPLVQHKPIQHDEKVTYQKTKMGLVRVTVAQEGGSEVDATSTAMETQ